MAMGAMIVGYYVYGIHTADHDTNDDEDVPLRQSYWRVLPRWVRAATIGIGFPAWIVLAMSILTGHWDTPLQHVAFTIFMTVAVVQTAFLFRSHWRMEL